MVAHKKMKESMKNGSTELLTVFGTHMVSEVAVPINLEKWAWGWSIICWNLYRKIIVIKEQNILYWWCGISMLTLRFGFNIRNSWKSFTSYIHCRLNFIFVERLDEYRTNKIVNFKLPIIIFCSIFKYLLMLALKLSYWRTKCPLLANYFLLHEANKKTPNYIINIFKCFMITKIW